MAEYWGFDQVDIDGLIFTSYNSLDWRRVAPIALELRKLGVPVWYDYGLEAGTRGWRTQISVHIEKAAALVIFVTKGIFERKESYVIEEYEEAKALGIPVLPVFLDNVTDGGYFRTIDPQYRSYVMEWNRQQGIVCFGSLPENSLAQEIKQRLDRSSEITYKNVMCGDKESERKVQAEAARLAAQRERMEQQTRQAAKPAVKVGSRVAFGSYPQSSNTPKPIMWRVLDIIDGKALMISESLLDCKQYNEQDKSVTWETCTLRRWLNGEFMNRAFSNEERSRLSRVKIPNPDDPISETKGGNPTEDYVFCLSIDEADKYFGGDKDRKAKPTALARKNGCYVSSGFGTGSWWLRSPGIHSNCAAYVHTNGNLNDCGFYVYSYNYGVRPVVLARL